ARWCDMVVADYNYYFDFGAMLFGLAQLNQWRVAVLVDEAHNLVERGRAMYSADLDQFALKSVRDSAPEPLHKPLQRLNREWNALHKEQVTVYQAYASKPDKLLQALALCTSAMGEYFNDHPQALTGELQSFYFEALQFAKVAELFNEQFIFDISQRDPLAKRRFSRLSLRNVVPAEFIRPRLTAARSSVLFSATLSPRHYYADLLGLPADTAWIDVESPFEAAQLQVRII
ncbi:MAG: ATP-dependent DNA helicase, partial [Pseudomonas sp.]